MEYDVIFDITEDSRGALWVGTFHNGLLRIEPEANRFVAYRQDVHNPYSLLNDRVQTIYKDRSGVMWIGHYRSGISRYVLQQDQFWRNKLDDAVFAICQDLTGNLWVGTEHFGLQKYGREGELIGHYYPDPQILKNHISNAVLAICQDR